MSFLDRLFRRNKKNNTEEKADDANNINQTQEDELKKYKELYEEEVKQNKEKQDELINENERLKEQLNINETKISELISEEISKQFDKHSQEKEISKTIIEDTGEIGDVSKKEPQPQKRLGKYGHHPIFDTVYIYKSVKKLYHIESIVDGKFTVVNGRGKSLTFGPALVKHVVSNLDYYYNNKYDIFEIGAVNNLSEPITMRLLFNIKYGTFDEWLEENNEEEPKIERIEKEDKHIRNVPSSFRIEYEITGLTDDNKFKFTKTTSHFTVEDVIKVKEAIPDFEKYPDNKSLLNLVNDGWYVNERLIWNIEEEIFDVWINLYLQNKDDAEIDIEVDTSWRDYHPFFKDYKMPASAQWLFEFKKWSSIGKSQVTLPGNYTFTLLDILYIKARLDDYYEKNFTSIMIADDTGLSESTANRILFNLANGVLDEYLDNYLEFNDYEFKIISPQYQYKLDYIKLHESFITVKHPKCVITYPCSLVRSIKNQYEDWEHEELFIADILVFLDYAGYDISESKFSVEYLAVLIYNIIYEYRHLFESHGTKSESVDDFLYEDHCFESKSGMLFIDGVETNLTIAKVNLMIHEYINANDKDECVRRMAKSYYMVDEKHVKLVCYYWDNPAFRKLRKSDADKVAMINDPHKRPASNTPVYV